MLKAKIEAILFLTDKPMRAQAIARIVNEDVQAVRQSILELINDYEERKGGLEISDDNGYIIQVKDEYSSIIDEFVPMEMPIALVRTLSAIAIKQPVPQSEIIKIRGAGAYDHIKELVERDLIIKKEDGRSPMLSTTKKFQEYFRLSHDAKSLRNELRKDEKKEAAALAGEADGMPVQLPIEVGGLDGIAAATEFVITGETPALGGMIAGAEFAAAGEMMAANEDLAADALVAAVESAGSLEAAPDFAPPASEEDEDYEDEKVEEEIAVVSAENLRRIFDASPDASLVYRPGDSTKTADSADGEVVPPQTETVDPPAN